MKHLLFVILVIIFGVDTHAQPVAFGRIVFSNSDLQQIFKSQYGTTSPWGGFPLFKNLGTVNLELVEWQPFEMIEAGNSLEWRWRLTDLPQGAVEEYPGSVQAFIDELDGSISRFAGISSTTRPAPNFEMTSIIPPANVRASKGTNSAAIYVTWDNLNKKMPREYGVRGYMSFTPHKEDAVPVWGMVYIDGRMSPKGGHTVAFSEVEVALAYRYNPGYIDEEWFRNPTRRVYFWVAFVLKGGLEIVSDNPNNWGHLKGPPALLSLEHQILVAQLNSSIQMLAQLDPVGAAQYAWLKGGKVLPGLTAEQLSLANIRATDAAVYQVRTSGATAVKSSGNQYLVVTHPAVPSASADHGKTLTLNAQVSTPSGVTATFQWMKQGEALSNDTRIKGADNKTLTIKNVNADDAGSYSCMIILKTTEDEVRATSGETVVTIVEKPVLDAEDLASYFDDVRVGQGIDFTLTADNGPTKFAITGLPSGLKLDAATGRIYGVPTAAKVVKGVITPYTLKISASNTAGTSAPETVSWTVQPLYPGVIGTYNGLVAHDQVNQDLGGSLKLTVASTAALSGTLKLGALSYTLKGSLSFAGLNDTPSGQISITRKSPLTTLVIDFEINKDTGKLTGTVADDESGPADITAWRTPWSSANKANDYVATYNTALDPSGGQGPEGYGFMPVKVTNTGAVSWTGKLADGTGITGSTSLGPDGQIALQHILYSNTGSIQGWMSITSDTGHLDGLVYWFKAGNVTRSYKGGFENTSVEVIGAPYNKPAGAVLDLPTPELLNAKITLTCGEAAAMFPGPAEHFFTITNKNAVTPDLPNDYTLKLSLAAATGTFSGSITLYDPDETDYVEPIAIIKRTVSYTGILVTREDFNQGAGYFIVDQLPYMEPIADTDKEKRITSTPQWSGSAVLEAVE